MSSMESAFRLDGRVIVITGGAGLLGKKHTEVVAAFGGIPVIIDLSQDAVDSTVSELNERFGCNAVGAVIDITDEQQVKAHSEQLFDTYGCIDGLVNNAANNPKVEDSKDVNFSRLEQFPLDVWNQDVAVGLTGSYLCAKHYGEKIARNPAGGSIVNISSDLGVIAPDQRLYRKEGVPEQMQSVKPVTYSVVKTGLIGLTRYLATYWTEQGVRCNAMCPGGVENGQDAVFLAEVSKRIPMNRMARPDEYQGALIWMLSDASSYLNGAVITVDGGRTAW